MGAAESHILVVGSLPREAVDLMSRCRAVDAMPTHSTSALAKAVAPYQALIVGARAAIDEVVLNEARELRVIACTGEPSECVDLEAATRRGVVVVAAAGSPVSSAEYAIASLLALARHIPQAHASLRSGRWERNRFVGVQVRRRTLGLIGLGQTGREVARRARGLEMRVVACDPFVSHQYAQSVSAEMLSLDELLGSSDFVSVHVPLTDGTRQMIGERELGLMRRGSHLVNASSADVLDFEAVLRTLGDGTLGGLALDSLPTDPATAASLLANEKVVVTPRLGSWTEESQREMAVETVSDVLGVLDGRPARLAVNTLAMAQEEYATLGPYIALAEHLGSLLSQLSDGCWQQIEMLAQGEIAQGDTTPLLSAASCGVLRKALPERANLANSLLLARSRGISLVERKDVGTPDKYSNLLTLRSPAPHFVDEVVGTVVDGRPCVVRLGRYWVNMAPTDGYVFLSQSADRPGIVGRVGTLLGSAGIGFSSLQLGRRGPEGRALMVMKLDEPVPSTLMPALLQAASAVDGRLVRF